MRNSIGNEEVENIPLQCLTWNFNVRILDQNLRSKSKISVKTFGIDLSNYISNC